MGSERFHRESHTAAHSVSSPITVSSFVSALLLNIRVLCGIAKSKVGALNRPLRYIIAEWVLVLFQGLLWLLLAD